ncbi:hypothetical protein GF361_02735 [Candidatus Woesearchaeota archaeon]|nr:hypothetical protein [Candidatus Woesearchaeota archaeon]
MATFLDIGVLNYFSMIFPALLVFVLVFAILEKTKMLGESKTLHAMAAIVAAFMVMLSRNVLAIINVGAPWFVMIFIFLILLVLLYRFMGASEEDLSRVIRTDKNIQWLLFFIGIVIVLSSIAHIYGQRFLEQESESVIDGKDIAEGEEGAAPAEDREGRAFSQELYNTFFSPKILGLTLIILIAVFTIALLSKESV